MSGFYVTVSVVAIACAVASLAVLAAAMLKMSRHAPHRTVHVNIGGKTFEVEDVDPRDIDAVLAGVKRKVSETHAPKHMVDVGD